MPSYNLHIMDGKEARVAIDAESSHQAIDTGINALAQFVFRNFPPPENVSIAITDEHDAPVAKVSFAFNIEYADRILS